MNFIDKSKNNFGHLTHPKYRADIDGLRAIAVLSVVGFHAFPNLVKGGFIGVDIFFVISGFLISTIIISGLERNSFSFIEFYSRRIKRIFPALLVVLIASYAAGWFTLLADEYKQLGKHIAGGAGFLSNFVLWGESGYFDNAAETKPLLHLWSLGIEEQFYIIWPLLLWSAWKGKLNLLAITVVIAIILFSLNIEKIDSDAIAAFYSPHLRFWELLIGSTLAYITLFNTASFHKLKLSTPIANISSFCGVILIATGILVITKERTFPGWWALLPTFGTTLVIAAGTQAWLNRVLLSNRVLVWFGLISFPLYLWHWPLLTFARIVEGKTPSFDIRIVAVAISVLLAWLTYKLIEKPIRFSNNSSRKVYTLLSLMTLTGCFGYYSYVQEGFEGYGYRSKEKSEFSQYFENSLPEQKYFATIGINEKYRDDCNFYDIPKYRMGKATKIPLSEISKSCYEQNASKKNVLFIWGDSHAQQLYFGLKNNLPEDWQVLIVASSGCGADFNVAEDSSINYCQRSNWFALKQIKAIKPNVVIVAQKEGHQFETFEKTENALKNMGVGKVLFIGPTPQWKNSLPKIIMRKLWHNTPERTFLDINEKIILENSNLKAQFSKSKNLIFLDLFEFFCDDRGCLTRIGHDKKTGITTADYGHLTPIASDYLAKNLLVGVIIGNSEKSQ